MFAPFSENAKIVNCVKMRNKQPTIYLTYIDTSLKRVTQHIF